MAESPTKGFSNFESHFTIEPVLYFYYPASWLRFLKVQGFPLLENEHGGVTTSLKINVIFLEKIDIF